MGTELHPDPLISVDEMLQALAESFPDVTRMPHQTLRDAIRTRVAAVTNLEDVARTDDVALDSGLRLRLYHPHGESGDAPAVLYFHGGGWVFCGIESHDGFCRRLCRETRAIVVSVEYRLAPEHPWPAALEDAAEALHWLHANAAALGVIPARIIAMGDSAGGNLAAALCLMIRGRPGPALAGQVLLYPVLDMDFTTQGYGRFGEGHYNTTQNMRWYWRQYLGSGALPDPPDLAAPLRAASHHDLPPAVVVIPGRDPTCTEGEAYVTALRQAGVPVRVRLYPDMFHGFLTMLPFGPAEGPRRILWSDMARLLSPVSTMKGRPHD